MPAFAHGFNEFSFVDAHQNQTVQIISREGQRFCTPVRIRQTGNFSYKDILDAVSHFFYIFQIHPVHDLQNMQDITDVKILMPFIVFIDQITVAVSRRILEFFQPEMIIYFISFVIQSILYVKSIFFDIIL